MLGLIIKSVDPVSIRSFNGPDSPTEKLPNQYSDLPSELARVPLCRFLSFDKALMLRASIDSRWEEINNVSLAPSTKQYRKHHIAGRRVRALIIRTRMQIRELLMGRPTLDQLRRYSRVVYTVMSAEIRGENGHEQCSWNVRSKSMVSGSEVRSGDKYAALLRLCETLCAGRSLLVSKIQAGSGAETEITRT